VIAKRIRSRRGALKPGRSEKSYHAFAEVVTMRPGGAERTDEERFYYDPKQLGL
jgi:hypothetical protein